MNRYNPEGYHYDPRVGGVVDKWGRMQVAFDMKEFRKARKRVLNPARKAIILRSSP